MHICREEILNVSHKKNKQDYMQTCLNGLSLMKSKVTQWRIWLRRCATCRNVARSITDGVIRIFHLVNLSGRTLPMGSNQLLTEISTKDVS
jgi:hypothetical protein